MDYGKMILSVFDVNVEIVPTEISNRLGQSGTDLRNLCSNPLSNP
jgi:hypothetical protein